MLGGEDRCGRPRDNQVNVKRDELGRNLRLTLALALRPTVFNCEVSTLNPTKVTEPIDKRRYQIARN
jgi:hypothetical protein